jgi:hypothetical protein
VPASAESLAVDSEPASADDDATSVASAFDPESLPDVLLAPAASLDDPESVAIAFESPSDFTPLSVATSPASKLPVESTIDVLPPLLPQATRVRSEITWNLGSE